MPSPPSPTGRVRGAQQAGALAPPPTRAEEWALVRAVAEAGRLGRPHLRRPSERRPERLRCSTASARRTSWLGVWGADPLPEEGEAASIVGRRAARRKGVLLGRGRVAPALVIARNGTSASSSMSTSSTTSRSTVAGTAPAGCARPRATGSSSTARGSSQPCNRSTAEPWLSGDAIRTAAAWAGIIDAAAHAAYDDLAAKPERPTTSERPGGGPDRPSRRRRSTAGSSTRPRPGTDLTAYRDTKLRYAVAEAGATVLDEASRATGSRPFATGTALDRARRDFELFVLQHRLDPLVARMGRQRIKRGD